LKRSIVITTINSINSTSIPKYLGSDRDLIIVGDQKTPHEQYEGRDDIIYINECGGEFTEFCQKLPKNHYGRKNLGYLFAKREGYSEIFDTDDDNYPLSNFLNFSISDLMLKTITGPKFPNIFDLFQDEHIWPRGYPIELVNNKQEVKLSDKVHMDKIGIIQSLSNGEADVDAIFRLTSQNYSGDIEFKVGMGYILESGVYSQVNTQITLWVDPEIFHLLYIPVTTTFRFCDILKGYVAQRAMWEYGKSLCYVSPLVEQKRNDHNLMKDFQSEIPMYTEVYSMVNNIFNRVSLHGDKGDLLKIYKELYRDKIVQVEELELIEIWLEYF
jgi:hypothetical protein